MVLRMQGNNLLTEECDDNGGLYDPMDLYGIFMMKMMFKQNIFDKQKMIVFGNKRKFCKVNSLCSRNNCRRTKLQLLFYVAKLLSFTVGV